MTAVLGPACESLNTWDGGRLFPSGYMDAAILDWANARDIPREKLRDLLLAAFAGALMAAQQADPRVRLRLG